MSEQERIMNVALLLWGGCFCLTAAFCLSMGNDHNREKRNWLLWMELSAAALLCCDAAAWFVQGTPGEASHLIMVATNFVVYAGLYLVLFLFNHYVGCYLREDGRLCAPKRSRAVDITCAVGIGLVFVSQFSPLLYYIDAQNIYHRSDTFPLSMALLLIGMGTETTMMVQFYQKLTMGRRIAMFGCVVLPLSVAACQVFQDDISLISLSVAPSQRDELVELMQNSKEVLQCYHVTGAYTFLIKVSCGSMPQLEHLILQFQKLGTTSTQIILSTPVNHGDLEAMML